MLVVEAGLAAHEHFPQRPFVSIGSLIGLSAGSLATIWSERTTQTLVPSWRRV